MSLIDQARADVEARRRETVAPKPGQVSGRILADLQEEPAVETGQIAPRPVAPQTLAGMNFDALFRSDREPTRLEFAVADHPCFVELTPLDKDDRAEFARKAGGAAVFENGLPENAHELMDFMVGRTLTDYRLWTRQRFEGGEWGNWQELRPAAGGKGIANSIRSAFKALPEFWDLLVLECSRVNGFDGEQSGN